MWLVAEIALAITSFLFIGLLYWYLTIPKNLPPGPTGLPFIGSSLDTWKASQGYTNLRKWAQEYGPIYKFYIANKLVVVLADWNLIQESLVKKGDVFAGRPQFFSLNPPNFPLDHGELLNEKSKSPRNVQMKQERLMNSMAHPDYANLLQHLAFVFASDIGFPYRKGDSKIPLTQMQKEQRNPRTVLGLIGSEGPLWKEQRRFALSTLRDFGLGRSLMEPRIKEEIDHFLAAMEDRRQSNPRGFDPQSLIGNAVSNVICALVFGRRFEYDDAEFAGLLELLNDRITGNEVSQLTPFVLSDWLASLLAHSRAVRIGSFDGHVPFYFSFGETEGAFGAPPGFAASPSK